MNGNPTAAQKRFHQWCRDHGCIVTEFNNPSIHHIKGAKMRLKGCKKAGEWYVIPLSYLWHQDGNNKSAIHVNKSKFEMAVANEKTLWLSLIARYEFEHGEKPMSEEEYNIIVERA